MIIRLRFRKRSGPHTHVRVFAGEPVALALCGELTFRDEEWEVVSKALPDDFEIVDDDAPLPLFAAQTEPGDLGPDNMPLKPGS